MPLTVPLTDELIRALAPDDTTWQRAEAVVRANPFVNPGVSADGTWLIAEAKGSARDSYHISADFVDPAGPVLRSTSPSRKTPDKYSLALALKYARDPAAFGQREPSDDLLQKREKKVAADERKKFGPAAPKRSGKTLAEKKAMAQREGLEVVERLLVDLVAGGQWFEETRLEKIERQAKHLADCHLPMAMYTTRRLLLLGKQKGIGEEERLAVGADLIGLLYATLKASRAYLDNTLPDGDTQEQADSLVEEAIGRTWQIGDLREKGYGRENMSLYELAYERTDDDARQQRIEASDLIELTTGEVLQSVAHRPYKGLNQIPDQPSYSTPLAVPEAVVCPGFVTRRVRWEKGGEAVARGAGDALEKAYAHAKPDFKAVLDAFRGQLQHPLAPREALFLLRCEKVGKIGDRYVAIEDAAGVRIEAADKRKDYSNSANLVRAAGMLGRDHPAVLVRLFVQPLQNSIVAVPLAAITPKHHLRLGL